MCAMPQADLARTIVDMHGARAELLGVIAGLSRDDMTRVRAGGWTVGRVLWHLIESESIYVKLLAHQTGRVAPEVLVSKPSAPEDAPPMLSDTRAAVLKLVDALDDETLYRMTRVGHEEYSPLSLLENIAAHEREHAGQISELVAGDPSRRTVVATTDVWVRPAALEDLPRLTEIYNHYVIETPTTFDTEPFTADQRREWFSHYAETGRHRLVVAERGSVILGYASTSKFHPRAAYDTTVELTALCAPDAVGQGVGQRLYEHLFDAIRCEDIHVAMALITLPNRGSVALHERFGFRCAMVVREAGRKFDKYWDVAWYEKRMR
jgi:phosphinothricin acetyltransferase